MPDEKFKALIEDKIRALLALQDEAEAGCDTVALDQSCVGRLSRMDAMQSQAMNQAAQRRRILELSRLKSALQNIDQGSFGECRECGEYIGDGRLMLDLAANYCVACAGRREQV